jgi:hypothetical protein
MQDLHVNWLVFFFYFIILFLFFIILGLSFF